MIFNENRIVENISEIPITLEEVSESVFEGVSPKNGLMHRLYLPEERISNSVYFCKSLCKPVFLESELVYPYVPVAFSEKLAFHPSPHSFMLPYELAGEDRRKKYRAIPPEELKARFPLAYRRILEFKKEFRHDNSPLNATDYSMKGKKFLEYLNTPKIIVTEDYRLQAAYDAAGKYIFEQGCGIVLKDRGKYPYITAVLNSSIARIFPSLCKHELIYSSAVTPAVIKCFPIVFPDNRLTEELIDTISSYLIYLKKQKYVAYYGGIDRIRELVAFYEQISNLLVLDTYYINELDTRLLHALEENVHPYAGDMESDNNESLMDALYFIKKQILETSNLRKYRLNTEPP